MHKSYEPISRARSYRKHIALACMLIAGLLFAGAFLFASPAEGEPAENEAPTYARIIYHFTPQEQLDANAAFSEREADISSVCTGQLWQEGDRVFIQANAQPGSINTSSDASTFRVIKDYASTSAHGAGAQDITAEAHYNAESGIVELPGAYAGADLTVAWYLPSPLQDTNIAIPVTISKTIEGTSSEKELSFMGKADDQTIDVTLFDDEQHAARVKNIRITQGGSELTQYVYQNGALSINTSPLGGQVDVELDDESQVIASQDDAESRISAEPPLLSVFSAANPAVGERFTIPADGALIRTCEPGGNMASVMGWPEKSRTYGFAVHFNSCPNPEVVNADQGHIAPGGTVHTPGGGTYDYGWVKGMHFAWGECSGNVDDNGTGEPKVQSGWVEVTKVDYATQTVSYRFFLDVCSDIDGHDMQSIMGTFQVHEDLVGYLELKKRSALEDVSANNSLYTFEGARYGVYSDPECTELKATLVTDAHGCARSKALPVGTYYVKELAAPNGYALDVEVHEASVAAGITRTITLDELPQSDPTPLLLAKHDSDHAYNSEHNPVQGGATSFLGAEFTITFHPTLDADYAKTAALRTWVVKTDENGIIDLRKGEDCKVSGDDFFHDSTGEITLPIGTYAIRETKAPEGYNLNETVFTRTVTGIQNGGESVSSYDPPLVADNVIRGGIELEKRDAESGLQSALGAATLDNTTFTITNDNAHDVRVNGIFYAPGEVCAHLITTEGKAVLASDALPYGHYTLRETTAGDGYTLSDSASRTFSIEHEGQIVRFSDSIENAADPAFRNQVKRGDINFVKVHEGDERRLAGIPFKITSKTTGEAHVIVSDRNGIVNTSANWVKHTHQTNQNDGGDHDAERGIWFGKTTQGTITDPRDDLGALPYDTYLLEELACEANKGFELVKTEFVIYRNEQQLDFGTIENRDPALPWITTVASDSLDHDKLLDAASNVTINDHVRYGNLKQNETYVLRAALVDKESGEEIPHATGETTFTPSESSGSTEVSIPVNLLDVTSKEAVIYETLYRGDEVILEHNEIDNSEQSVSIVAPRIATMALDAADGDHLILNDEQAHLVDTVSFANLVPGEEYTIVGTLMIKQGGEGDDGEIHELTDAAGTPITSSNTFTPQTESGSIEVTFAFDASALEVDTELVVFERLTHNDQEVVSHEDPNDQNQTIRIIEPQEPPTVPTAEEPSLPPDDQGSLIGTFAKTGSAILPWIIGVGILLATAFFLIGIAYRQHRKARAVTEAIAHNMLGIRNDRRP